MTALLDPVDATKLAKICGLLGSDHLGERAAAAAMADRIVRDLGLTWFDVVAPPRLSVGCSAIGEKVALALRNIGAMSQWERGFLYSVAGKRKLSSKQLAILEELVAKAEAYAEAS